MATRTILYASTHTRVLELYRARVPRHYLSGMIQNWPTFGFSNNLFKITACFLRDYLTSTRWPSKLNCQILWLSLTCSLKMLSLAPGVQIFLSILEHLEFPDFSKKKNQSKFPDTFWLHPTFPDFLWIPWLAVTLFPFNIQYNVKTMKEWLVLLDH
jgi:hypothetical protein